MEPFAIALGASAVLGGPVLLALRAGRLVDVPGARSSHRQETPRGGGLAVLGGLLAGLVAASISGSPVIALAVATCTMAALGFLDDLRSVPPLTRLGVQAALAIAPLPWLLDGLSGTVIWQVVFAGGVWIWLVAYVNACNFMDGINGLAVAHAVVGGAAWWVLGADQSVPALEAGGMVLAGAALGFLPYNYPRAFMFLGDVGSYAIGAWVASVVVIGLRGDVAPVSMVAPVTVFLVDTATTIWRRAARGEDWYEAHRSHAYQRLVAGGWSHARTTAFVSVVMVAVALLGFAVRDAGAGGQLLAAGGIGIVLVAYLATPRLVARRG